MPTTRWFRVPVWMVAAVAAALLFGLFLTCATLLGGGSEAVAETIATLHSADKIESSARASPAPPPPPPPPPAPELHQVQRLHPVLPRRRTSITDPRSAPNSCSILGQAEVKARASRRSPPTSRATSTSKPGKMKVVGHTDSRRRSDRPLSFELRCSQGASACGRHVIKKRNDRAGPRRDRRPRARRRRSPQTRHPKDEPKTGASKSSSHARPNKRRRREDGGERDRGTHDDQEARHKIILYGVGLGSLAALVYFAGPLIAFGGLPPARKLHRSPNRHRAAGQRRWRRLAGSSSRSAGRAPRSLPRASAGQARRANDEPVLKEQDEGRARDAEDGERRQEATTSTICPGTC